MNVDQLIKRLQMYPQDLRVVIRGYEGGYDDINNFEQLKIVLDYNAEWYYGKHDDASFIQNEEAKANAVDALRIG
jgi:hypothetical protein